MAIQHDCVDCPVDSLLLQPLREVNPSVPAQVFDVVGPWASVTWNFLSVQSSGG